MSATNTPITPDALLSAITMAQPCLLQQDHLAQLLELAQTTAPASNNNNNNNFMIDDWLADELQHSGLLAQTDLLSSAASTPLVQTPTSVLPQSPPLTASPPQEKVAVQQQQASPCLSLFPDIWPKQEVAIVNARPALQRRPVPIMPKTEMVVPSPATPQLSVVGSKRKAGSVMSDKESDDIALKRQRNTDAARRSRLKKLLKMECLETRVTELEGENTRLTTRVAVLESEKSGLESKDKDLQERIRVLEEQLAEAHRALTAKCSH